MNSACDRWAPFIATALLFFVVEALIARPILAQTVPTPPQPGGQSKPSDSGDKCPESDQVRALRIRVADLNTAAQAAEAAAKADEAYWLKAVKERGPTDPETSAASELKEKSATAAVKARQAARAAEAELANLAGKPCPPPSPGTATPPGSEGAAQPGPAGVTPPPGGNSAPPSPEKPPGSTAVGPRTPGGQPPQTLPPLPLNYLYGKTDETQFPSPRRPQLGPGSFGPDPDLPSPFPPPRATPPPGTPQSMAPGLPPDGLYAGGGAMFVGLGGRTYETHFDDGVGRDRNRFAPGFGLLLRGGVKQGPVRFEGEFAYRNNALSTLNGLDDAVHGGMEAFTFMANALYDFTLPPEFMGLTPHVGVGAGVGHLVAQQKIGGFTVLDSSDTQFAYQAIAGLRMPIADGVALDLDYRYAGTTDPTFRSPVGRRVTTQYGTHSVLASLTFSFGGPGGSVAAGQPTPALPSPRARQVASLEPVATATPASLAQPAQHIVVRFDERLAALTPSGVRALDAAVAAARAGVPVRVEIEGCTGTPEEGSERCARRTQSLTHLLARRGVANPGRLLAEHR